MPVNEKNVKGFRRRTRSQKKCAGSEQRCVVCSGLNRGHRWNRSTPAARLVNVRCLVDLFQVRVPCVVSCSPWPLPCCSFRSQSPAMNVRIWSGCSRKTTPSITLGFTVMSWERCPTLKPWLVMVWFLTMRFPAGTTITVEARNGPYTRR